jgi:hypothetical protein
MVNEDTARQHFFRMRREKFGIFGRSQNQLFANFTLKFLYRPFLERESSRPPHGKLSGHDDPGGAVDG